jgi:hypothetical protein
VRTSHPALSASPGDPIRVVARRTGLSADVIGAPRREYFGLLREGARRDAAPSREAARAAAERLRQLQAQATPTRNRYDDPGAG